MKASRHLPVLALARDAHAQNGGELGLWITSRWGCHVPGVHSAGRVRGCRFSNDAPLRHRCASWKRSILNETEHRQREAGLDAVDRRVYPCGTNRPAEADAGPDGGRTSACRSRMRHFVNDAPAGNSAPSTKRSILGRTRRGDETGGSSLRQERSCRHRRQHAVVSGRCALPGRHP